LQEFTVVIWLNRTIRGKYLDILGSCG